MVRFSSLYTIYLISFYAAFSHIFLNFTGSLLSFILSFIKESKNIIFELNQKIL